MYRGLRVLAMAPAYNEDTKIGSVVERVPMDVVDEMVVFDDGSTDRTASVAKAKGAHVISAGRRVYVGEAIRRVYEYGVEHNYDVVVVMAGNNKDSPEEIPLLLDPIVDGKADFVQGSRWLGGKTNFGPMPFYRKVATRVHPLLFSLVSGKRVTESTNGFRAVTRAVLTDKRIDLKQPWLQHYELEPYLYLKTIKLGYKTAEVPVTKIYPPKKLGQTKMKPISGWWSMVRPLVLVGLGVKQ